MLCCPCSSLLIPTLRSKATIPFAASCPAQPGTAANPLKSEGSGKHRLYSWYLLARWGQRLGVPMQLSKAIPGMYSLSLTSLQGVMMFCVFSGSAAVVLCCTGSLNLQHLITSASRSSLTVFAGI